MGTGYSWGGFLMQCLLEQILPDQVSTSLFGHPNQRDLTEVRACSLAGMTDFVAFYIMAHEPWHAVI